MNRPTDPTSDEIESVIRHLRIRARRKEKSGVHVIGDCPVCGKAKHFYVNVDKGLWDCFTADTRVITSEGTKPIGELAGTEATILSHLGWQRAPFMSGGVRRVMAVTLVRDRIRKVIKATPGHRWALRDGSFQTTERLREGDRMAWAVADAHRSWSREGFEAGVLFGDGCGNNGAVELWGPKRVLLEAFATRPSKVTPIGPTDNGVHGVRVCGLSTDQKDLPSLDSDQDFLLGWLMGYMATDGTFTGAASPCIDSANRDALEHVRDVANVLGIATSPIGSYWRKGFPGYEGELHRVTIRMASLWSEFFQRPDQRRCFDESVRSGTQRLSWRVESVEEAGEEEVFCCEVPVAETFTLEDNLLTGNCKRCGEAGNLWQLANHLHIRVREKQIVQGAASFMINRVRESPAMRKKVKNAPGITLSTVETAAARLFDDDDEHGQRVREYLHGRGFDDATIKHFQLTACWIRPTRDERAHGDKPELGVGIPYVNGDKVPLMKMRNLVEGKEGRKFRRTAGGDSPLYNGHAVKGFKRVVLMEAELDAVSAWQLGIAGVAATSIGAKKELPEEWILQLNDAEDIVLWYDDDEAGEEAVLGLMEQLGSYRCRIANIDDAEGLDTSKVKDANDILRLDVDEDQKREWVRQIVDGAKGVDDSDVVAAHELGEAVVAEINMGIDNLGQETGFACADRLVKGWRPGEVTIVTGHSGHGKTTFATALTDKLVDMKVPCLVGSFENGPENIVRKRFQRKWGHPLSKIKSERDRSEALKVLDRMREDPLFLMNISGRQERGRVWDAIKWAHARHGVRHVLIDHLHYFRRYGTDIHQHIEELCQDFAGLAKELWIHIFVVCHVNAKVNETHIPNGGDLKGGSVVKQEASNGITIYRAKDMKGDPTSRKMKLKDGSGRKIETELSPNQALMYVWKARHEEAREGTDVLNFDATDLVYRDGNPFQSREDEDPFADLGGTGLPF